MKAPWDDGTGNIFQFANCSRCRKYIDRHSTSEPFVDGDGNAECEASSDAMHHPAHEENYETPQGK